MTSPEPLKTLVVVPTYEEVENVDELLAAIWKNAPDVEVLFVDDNSTDGTRELIEKHQALHPGRIHTIYRPRKLGLGTAYVEAFNWALERDYEIVAEMDADLSHDAADLPRMFALLCDADVAIGSRYVPGGGTRNWGLLRKTISRFGGLYARAILGLKINDLTGGFNGWRRCVLETIPLDSIKSEGYSFQIELKYRAVQAGFTLREFPIVFVDRRVGQSKMSNSIVFEAMLRVWALRFGGRGEGK
jgi:dolichol-phosphate mannosyltransferase